MGVGIHRAGVTFPTKHPRLFGYRRAGSSLATSCGHGALWERAALAVIGLMLSRRCGWRGIQLTAILETSGICSLREMRRKVARRKNKLLLLALRRELAMVRVINCQKEWD